MGSRDHFDLGDFPAGNRKTQRTEQPSSRSHDHSDRAIHQCGPTIRCTAREMERLLRPGPCTLDLRHRARRQGGGIGTDHEIRVEQSD